MIHFAFYFGRLLRENSYLGYCGFCPGNSSLVYPLESKDETEGEDPDRLFYEPWTFVRRLNRTDFLQLILNSAGVCGVIRTCTVDTIASGTDYSCKCSRLSDLLFEIKSTTATRHYKSNIWFNRRNCPPDYVVLDRTHSYYFMRHSADASPPLQTNSRRLLILQRAVSKRQTRRHSFAW